MGFQNAGAKAGAPCSLEMLQGFPDLQMISFAASAECGRSGRLGYAGPLRESCECFLGSTLREKAGDLMVAVELPAPWRSGRASWPDPYDSRRGFRERSSCVRVHTFSRHTSGVIREIE